MRCTSPCVLSYIATILGLALVGCDSAPPSSPRGAASRPTPPAAAPADRPAPRPAPSDASQLPPPPPPAPPAPPTASPPTSPPPGSPTTEASKPTTQPPQPPAPPEPPVPGYIQIIEKFDPKARTTVQATAASGQQLEITTQNVKRLRIDRDHVPVDRTKSIALMLDGQPLEWLPRSKVEEFERSVNGRWQPVKPNP